MPHPAKRPERVKRPERGSRPNPNPNPPLWTIPPLWAGHTAVLIAGGPSLTRSDARHRLGAPGIVHLAINDAYRLIPEAALLYACDYRWWGWHHAHLGGFQGIKVTTDRRAGREFTDLKWVEGRHQPGLSPDPAWIHYGQNSGYQALNLAFHLGATRIVLLGYDLQRAASGETHWFGNHPDPHVSAYAAWIPNFRPLARDLKARGVEVINCSPETALDAFPRQSLTEALPSTTPA